MTDTRRRALVAGGAGFLGSHLCDALIATAYEVVCIDSLVTGSRDNIAALQHHPAFSFVEADVIDPLPMGIAKGGFSYIFNLACAASPPVYQRDPEHTLMTCVIGTRNLLQLAERSGARFMLTSTSEIYGEPLEHPQSESYRGNVNPIGPRACYDEGKRAAETLAFDYARSGRATVRVARIFNTYGPRLDRRDGRVVSNLIVQALSGDPLTIYGGGEQTRSFCYVDDLIAGLLALMRHDGAQLGPINLGNPEEITVLELAQRIARLTGTKVDIEFCPLPADDPQRRQPDISAARQVLGWQPATSLNDGLSATIGWFAGSAGAEPVPTASEILAIAA